MAAREEDAAAFRAAAEREEARTEEEAGRVGEHWMSLPGAEDALDFVVELLGLGLPWVTQALVSRAPPLRPRPPTVRVLSQCRVSHSSAMVFILAPSFISRSDAINAIV